MDVVCNVLKNYHLINEKEEEDMKKKIKDCLYTSKGIMLKILYYDVDLSVVYKEMKISNFGHLIAFYCLLETYDEYFINKTKEEKKDFIVQLTIQTLDDFQRYKKKRLQEKNNFSKNLFYKIFYSYIRTFTVQDLSSALTYFLL